MSSGNPCSKMVKREDAYEVWKAFHGEWYWYCLKKYQTPAKEAQNPYARWYCCVLNPITEPRGDYGDVYVAEIKAHAYKLNYNPLKEKNNATN